MKKRSTKLIAVCVIEAIMLCANSGVMGIDVWADVTDNMSEIVRSFTQNAPVLTMTFEDDSPEDLSGGTRKTVANRAGKVFSKNATSGSNWKNLDTSQAVDQGLLLISFDFMVPAEETGKLLYARLLNSRFTAMNYDNVPNMAETFWVYGNTAGFYTNSDAVSNNWLRTGVAELPSGAWHTIDMWMDMDADVIYYFFDDTYVGMTAANRAKLTDFCGIGFLSTATETYLDNIEVTRVSRNTLPAIQSQGVSLPDKVFHTVRVGGTGNLVEEKDASIQGSVLVTNDASAVHTLELNMTVTRERDNTVLSRTAETVQVPAGTQTAAEFTLPGVDEYGFYRLDVDVQDLTAGVSLPSDVSQFSVAHLPEPGTRNPRLGIINHVRHTKMGDPVINLEFIDKAGFSSTRSEVTWAAYERSKGNYALTDAYTRHLDAKMVRNMNHLEILSYDNSLYSSESPPVSDAALTAYANYSVALVEDIQEHMGDNRLEVEIWNEYNNPPDFNRDRREPEDYAKMLKYTYPALKKAYPDLFVWGMSTLGVPSNKDTGWIAKVLVAGGGDYMDGVSIHPYSQTAAPELGGAIPKIKQLKENLAAYGYENMPLRATEWGWPSRGVNGYPDEQHQAAYFVRANVLNAADDLFDYIDWYTINDGGEDSSYGLLRGPYTKVPYSSKPAYLAAANYNAIISGAVYRDKLEFIEETSGQVTAYRFRLRDGRDCMVLWRVSDGSDTVSMNLGAETASLIDIYGNETSLKGDNGVYTITCDAMPQYLIGSFPEFQRDGAQRIGLDMVTELDLENSTVTITGSLTDAITKAPVSGTVDLLVLPAEIDIQSATIADVAWIGDTQAKNGGFSQRISLAGREPGAYKLYLRTAASDREDTNLGFAEDSQYRLAYTFDLTRDTSAVTATARLGGEAAKPVRLILAQYQDEILLDIQTKEIPVSRVMQQYSLTADLVDGADTCKAYIWDSDDIRPLVPHLVK